MSPGGLAEWTLDAFVASHHSERHPFAKVCNVGHLPTADEDDLRVQTPSGFGRNWKGLGVLPTVVSRFRESLSIIIKCGNPKKSP